MDIRVSASAVSDGSGTPYKFDNIPHPAAFKQFLADQDALSKAPDGSIGRDGKLPLPKLREGIRLTRGGAAIVIKGVDEQYVNILKADRTRIVEILSASGETEQVIDLTKPVQADGEVAADTQ
jgi:hypothetical protein